MLRTDSASLRFFRQRIASFLSPRTDSASLRLVAEAIAVRDTRALVRSRSSVACVRAGDYAGNLTNWRENTRCAARPPASGATRPRRSRPAMQAGTATSRRRRCRLRPTFKGVMRCRMESPSDEAMRCRFAACLFRGKETLARAARARGRTRGNQQPSCRPLVISTVLSGWSVLAGSPSLACRSYEACWILPCLTNPGSIAHGP